MANSSDILNSIYPSPTKKVAAVSGAGSGSYSATSPVIVTVAYINTSGSVSIDGVPFAGATGEVHYNLGSGQSTSLSCGSGGGFILSVARVS